MTTPTIKPTQTPTFSPTEAQEQPMPVSVNPEAPPVNKEGVGLCMHGGGFQHHHRYNPHGHYGKVTTGNCCW